MEEDASKTLWMPPGCLEPCLEFSSTCYNHYKNQLAYSQYSERSSMCFHVKMRFYKRHGSVSKGVSTTSFQNDTGNLRKAKTTESCSEHLCANALVSACCFQERSAYLHRCVNRAAGKISSKMFWKLKKKPLKYIFFQHLQSMKGEMQICCHLHANFFTSNQWQNAQ